MSILEMIAGRGATSGEDIARAQLEGERSRQILQMKSLEMEEWLEERDHKKRLRDSLKGTDFTTPEGAAEASRFASEAEDPEMAITLSKLSNQLKSKDRKSFGDMKPIYSGGKQIGYAQKSDDGQLHNFKTLENIIGKKKKAPATKVGKPSNEQIETATNLVKESAKLGESDWLGVGFSSDDYGKLGRSIASRAMKLMADAKDLGQGISDQEAMNIAAQEIEDMGQNVYTKGSWGSKDLVEKIEFEPGTSSKLQEFLGISTSARGAGIQNISNVDEFNKLPSGAKYIDPNGVQRIKQ